MNVRNDVCLGVIESFILDCSLNTFSDVIRTTKSEFKMIAPPLCLQSMGLLLSPYAACRKLFYFPLLLVSVQWGCLLHHPWVIYLCQHSAGGWDTHSEQAGHHGWLFGRKLSNCWLQRLTVSYLRGGYYYTDDNKEFLSEEECKAERERNNMTMAPCINPAP